MFHLPFFPFAGLPFLPFSPASASGLSAAVISSLRFLSPVIMSLNFLNSSLVSTSVQPQLERGPINSANASGFTSNLVLRNSVKTFSQAFFIEPAE